MRLASCLLACTASLSALLAPRFAAAQGYDFQLIAEGPFNAGFSAPTLNNMGVLAFIDQQNGRIVKGDASGSSVVLSAASGPQYNEGDIVRIGDIALINDQSDVLSAPLVKAPAKARRLYVNGTERLSQDSGGEGITANPAPWFTHNGSIYFGSVGPEVYSPINEYDVPQYYNQSQVGPNGNATVQLQPIFDIDVGEGSARQPLEVRANDAGTVFYYDDRETNNIYDGLALTDRVVGPGSIVPGGLSIVDVAPLQVTTAGDLIFWADVGAEDGIYRWDGGSIETIFQPNSTIRRVHDSSASDSGLVGFGYTDQTTFKGSLGIVSDTGFQTVVSNGDELFGSTVITINGLSVRAVNDQGQIAFGAHLADNRQVIVLASPAVAEFAWANPASGVFGDPSKWDPAQVPGSSSTARISQAGTYTVTLNENATVGRLVIGGATGFANPTLDLNGHVQDSNQLLVDSNASLVVQGSTPGSLVRTDLMNVAPGSNLSGDFWVKPRTGTTATVENEGFQFLGPNDADAAVRTHFIRQGAGPEPDAFDAHVVVRGDFEQLAAGTLRANLSAAKAVNQGRDSTIAHAPQTATDLRVTGKVKLDGKLNLGFATGYVPQHGDSFSIVKGDDVTGSLTVNSPPAYNGLALKAVVTDKGVQAVVPQKVVLAFGHALPYAWETVVAFDRRLPFRAPTGPQTTPAFSIAPSQNPAFTTYLQTLLQRVQQHYTASGIEGVVFSLGDPQDDAINLYFIDPVNAPYTRFLGEAYTGIDRFNLKGEGGAAIAVRSFNPANPLSVETDAETIIHEVGHLLGLRHVDPAGATAIMDYDDARGDFELFVNQVSRIREPPQALGRLFPDMHNPVYHLKRYVDGVPHEDLVAMDILPGHWDLPGPIFEDLDASFRLRINDLPGDDGAPPTRIETLYDVIVYSSPGAPGENLDALARFAEISIAELAEQSFRISSGAGLGLVASSLLGGAHDVLLSLGNPFEEGAGAIYPGYGELEAFLQIEADNPAGFMTLADVTVAVSVVPEPGTIGLLSLCAIGAMTMRRARPRPRAPVAHVCRRGPKGRHQLL